MTVLFGHRRQHGLGPAEQRPQLPPLDLRVAGELGIDRRAERPDIVVALGARTAAASTADEITLQILQETGEDELEDVPVGGGMRDGAGVGAAEGRAGGRHPVPMS